MAKQKKYDKQQIWLSVMGAVGVGLGINVAQEYADSSMTALGYGAAFGGLGSVLGLGLFYLTLNASRLIKILAVILMFVLALLLVNIFPKSMTDEEIIMSDWHEQIIGRMDFESYQKLIPQAEFNNFPQLSQLTAMQIFSDDQADRVTAYTKEISQLAGDSTALETYFQTTVNKLLNTLHGEEIAHLNTNYWEKDTAFWEADDQIMTAQFSFVHENKRFQGFGKLFILEDTAEALWLLPVTKTFSKAFMEDFDAMIFVDSPE